MVERGFKLEDVCAALGREEIETLLPSGALHLWESLASDTNEDEQARYLAKMIQLESAVDDPARRRILLSTLPSDKVVELERRSASPVSELRQTDKLHAASRREIMGFFGRPPVLSSSPLNFSHADSVSPQRGLFPHQKHAAAKVENHLYEGTGRALLHLPTGTGKTRIAMSIVATNLRMNKGVVVWLASFQELLEQAVDEFEATWKVVGDRDIDCVKFWADHDPSIDNLQDGILVAGLAKLNSYGRGENRERLWKIGDRTTLIVFDEAHQAVATTYQSVLEAIESRRVKTPVLGLSATPGRTWNDPDEDSKVAKLFQNKVTLDYWGKNPIHHLTREGYLAQVNYSKLQVESDVVLSDRDSKELINGKDISRDISEQLGADALRNEGILNCVCNLMKYHQRILIFTPSVESAQLLGSVCRGLKYEADVITASTNFDERKRAIEKFKRTGGPPRILFNYGVLTTGFDAPNASAVVIARPTLSLVLYSQMIGRGIRGPKAGGTPECEIVTVVDTTLPGFGSVADAFNNWEDIWQIT